MNKKYTYIKEHEIPLYRGVLVIIISNDHESIRASVKSFKSTEPYAHTHLDNWGDKQGFITIFNFNNPYRKITHGVIAHEALHVSNFLASERGIKASNNNDEPMAYLTEWVVDRIYEFINKQGFIIE